MGSPPDCMTLDVLHVDVDNMCWSWLFLFWGICFVPSGPSHSSDGHPFFLVCESLQKIAPTSALMNPQYPSKYTQNSGLC